MPKNHALVDFPPQLLDVHDLARILRRPVATIYSQRTRSPGALPPACTLPGSRRPMWHPDDVQNWIDQHRASRQQEQASDAAGAAEQPRRRGRPRKSTTAQK